MPIYEYLSNKCQKTFEYLQMSGDGSDITCPHCHSGDISRMMSSFATNISQPGGGHKCGSGGFT